MGNPSRIHTQTYIETYTGTIYTQVRCVAVRCSVLQCVGMRHVARERERVCVCVCVYVGVGVMCNPPRIHTQTYIETYTGTIYTQVRCIHRYTCTYVERHMQQHKQQRCHRYIYIYIAICERVFIFICRVYRFSYGVNIGLVMGWLRLVGSSK